jgi:alkylation response protein AidB-like acyl-CoA dehydrogenase
VDFSLSDDQEQMVRAVARWIERSWAQGDVDDVEVRRTRWAELEANGWTGLLSLASPAMPVLDAALMVEQLAYAGCSLPVGPGAMVGPLVVEAAGLDPAAGIDQLLVLGANDGTRTARGLELADRIVVLTAEAGPDPESGPAPDPGPTSRAGAGAGGRRWRALTLAGGPGAGIASTMVVQDEGRMVLSRLAAPPDRGAAHPIEPGVGELAWLVGAVLSAAELVGLARSVLDGCVAYAKVRVQGGRPIGGHQAIQHRLADMLGGIERARYLTYQAAVTIAEGAPTWSAGRVLPVVHQAKALAARDCLAAIRSGHQVMGAIAYSAEHELHHLHKQAVVAAHEFGGADWHWAALEGAAPRD